jgi:hypothetical protein
MIKRHLQLQRLMRILVMLVVLVPAISLLSGVFNISPSPKADAAAPTFQAGHIIDDNVFTNSNALSAAQIQSFLDDMVGSCYSPGAKSTNPLNGACINQYIENPSTLQNNFNNPNASVPGGLTAAQIIYNAAQAYQINPEVLLVTMQKEQGLVTDNWPFYSEYQYAMGYACPDSSPQCSGTYADFYKQVDGAAWQFRQYLNNPGAYNYWIGSNNIEYAPGCGAGVVNIQNAATAALYIYTPYQPDSNVLANTNPIGSSNGPGPAINDSCAAYGNRNFWWYFNSWFGQSVTTNISLAEATGSSTYYVLYDGIKQGIPSLDVLNAWGLEGLPVETLDPSVLNAIPTASTALTRYVQVTSTGQNYFADNGNFYWVSSNDATDWNNFPGQSLSQASNTLVNFANFEGEIQPYVYVSGSSTYYVVDNGALHPVSSGNEYGLWAGNALPMQISSAYFNTMSQASTLSGPELTYGGSTYVLSNGTKFSLTSSTASLVPSSWSSSSASIGQGLFNLIGNAGPLQYMVQGYGDPTVYLLDGGTKRGIPDGQTYSAYQSNGNSTSSVSPYLVSLIPTGNPVSGNIVSTGGQYFVVNQSLQVIPPSLYSNYNVPTNAMALQTDFRSIIPVTSTVVPIVSSGVDPTIYYLDGGNRMPFSNPTTYGLLGGTGGYTYLLPSSLGEFTPGPVMSNYVSNGGSNYLIDTNQDYTVANAATTQAWGLSNPVPLSNVSIFTNAGNLSQHIQTPNGFFCLIDSSTSYCAGQPGVITAWNLLSNIVHPSNLLLANEQIGNGGGLPLFASYGSTIYTAAQGKLWGITSPSSAANLGFNGWAVPLSQTTVNALANPLPWQGYLATDDSGNLWVLDGGYRRLVLSPYTSDWLGSNTASNLGSAYLNMLPVNTGLTDSIVPTSNPTVFGMQSGQKYAFTSGAAFAGSGLPAPNQISNSLAQSISTGGIW